MTPNEELEPWGQGAATDGVLHHQDDIEVWAAVVKNKKSVARRRLRALGELMVKSADQGVKEFAGEGRLALLYSTFHIRNPTQLSTLLKWTIELVDSIETWCDHMRPKKSASRSEFQKITATIVYLDELFLVVDAQGTSEDSTAVAHTRGFLEKRRELYTQKVDDENTAFEKEVIEPIVQAATEAMNALTDLVDFVTSPRTA